MEIISIAALTLSLLAVILSAFILSKVNKLITMLRTPIVKKLSPDMNLKPSSRRPIGTQEMASRGDRNSNKDNRSSQGKERSSKENNRGNRSSSEFGRDRSDRRNGRNNNNNSTNRPRRAETEPAASAPAAAAPVLTEAPQVSSPARTPVEGRRPLAPRVPQEASPAPVFQETPAAVVVENNSIGSEFEPSKVRYGRRNVVKKVPDVDELSVSAELSSNG